jgi:hypothetical protein
MSLFYGLVACPEIEVVTAACLAPVEVGNPAFPVWSEASFRHGAARCRPPLPPEMSAIERRGEDAVVDERCQLPDPGKADGARNPAIAGHFFPERHERRHARQHMSVLDDVEAHGRLLSGDAPIGEFAFVEIVKADLHALRRAVGRIGADLCPAHRAAVVEEHSCSSHVVELGEGRAPTRRAGALGGGRVKNSARYSNPTRGASP